MWSGGKGSLYGSCSDRLHHYVDYSDLHDNQNIMNCIICEGEQQMRAVMYEVVCLSYDEFYIGQKSRPLRKRTGEDLKALHSPQSYPDNPFSQPLTIRHTRDIQPQLRISILHKSLSDTVEED